MSSAPHAFRRRLRFALFSAIGALYLVSVPWYRSADAPVEIVFGLPDWVAVALGCYVAVAVLNAVAWLLSEAPAEGAAEGRRDSPGRT